METIQRHRIKLLPKQKLFVESTEKETLYSGAFGGGKTWALCYKALVHAQIPGNLVLLCRKTRVSMKDTTLDTLFNEVLSEYGAPYRHFKSDSRVELTGGGAIIYMGFDQWEERGSLRLGAAAIDEATEINLKQYNMLLGRLRRTTDPNPQIFAACNPSAPIHFLYERFFDSGSRPDRRVITTNSFENTFLPDHYKQVLDGFTGQQRARYVEGKWVGFEGLVYDRWDREIYIKERRGPWNWLMVHVDDGYTNPFAVGLWGFDGDRRMHLIKEIYKTQLLPADKVKMLKALKADLYVVDPSAASLIADMEDKNMAVEPADNSREDGIRRVQDRFLIPGDGIPRFSVSESCTHFIREIESYTYQEDKTGSKSTRKDEPVRVMDHHMDGWRYLVNYVDSIALPTEVGAVATGSFI